MNVCITEHPSWVWWNQCTPMTNVLRGVYVFRISPTNSRPVCVSAKCKEAPMSVLWESFLVNQTSNHVCVWKLTLDFCIHAGLGCDSFNVPTHYGCTLQQSLGLASYKQPSWWLLISYFVDIKVISKVRRLGGEISQFWHNRESNA